MSSNAEARIRPTSILVGYVMDKAALRQGFHRVLRLSPVSFNQCSSPPPPPTAGQPLWVFSLLSFQYHIQSNTDTTHTLGLLWTSDRPVAETSTLQFTTITRDKHPCPRHDSNPHFQQASGRKQTPQTARLPGSATNASQSY